MAAAVIAALLPAVAAPAASARLQLASVAPDQASPSPFWVTVYGSRYRAISRTTGAVYVGTAKEVVDAALADLAPFGGGAILFGSGTFDFGSDQIELNDVTDLTFEGRGIGRTRLINNSSAADDTEVFDVVGADGVTIRDLAIAADGPARSTSDAIDMDNGSNSLIERVAILRSRGRGIVFDGKGTGWTAESNIVRDCVIRGIPGDGIELIASSNNRVVGCRIVDVGGHGIQINKSSTVADQPNKPSNGNLIRNNRINQAGQDGINLNSGHDNRVLGNVITNSADDMPDRDGIRIFSSDGVSCDRNRVARNIATDTQTPKTQRFGLNIASALCTDNVIGLGNDFAGNATGYINDLGTNTQHPPDLNPPTTPTGVVAVAVSHFQVDVSWEASEDDVGVTEYVIYRDGTQVGTVPGTTLTFRDATATGGTTYRYRVAASDAAGNRSWPSRVAGVETPPTPSSYSLNPSADAYVNASAPDTNFGISNALRLDLDPETSSYLRFDVGGVSGTVTRAILRVYANSGSSIGMDVSLVGDNSWTEAGITFNNAPAIGPLVGSTGAFPAGAYVEFDVTAQVGGNGPVSFALTTDSTTQISLGSRESATPPELVISLGP